MLVHSVPDHKEYWASTQLEHWPLLEDTDSLALRSYSKIYCPWTFVMFSWNAIWYLWGRMRNWMFVSPQDSGVKVLMPNGSDTTRKQWSQTEQWKWSTSSGVRTFTYKGGERVCLQHVRAHVVKRHLLDREVDLTRNKLSSTSTFSSSSAWIVRNKCCNNSIFTMGHNSIAHKWI